MIKLLNFATYLFIGQLMLAQSGYLSFGGGFLPNSYSNPVSQGQYWWFNTTTEYTKGTLGPGYNLYLGFGENIPLTDRWTIGGEWRFLFLDYPEKSESITYFKNNPEYLVDKEYEDINKQFLSWQLGLSAQRNLSIGEYDVELFGGCYFRFKLEALSKTRYRAEVFSEIGSMMVYDSLCQCNKEVLFISNRFDPPKNIGWRKSQGRIRYGQQEILNYGLHLGVNFPIFDAGEGSMKGQVLVTQDFVPFFRNQISLNNNFNQTAIMAGLVFTPTQTYRPSKSRPDRKPLPSGIYAGLSSCDIIIVSMDGSWHSSFYVGFDFSARYFIIFKGTSIYFGPNLRLGNSRFFLKAGAEYFLIDNDEYYDAYLTSYVGGKYLLPLSRRFGLRFDAGYVFYKRTNIDTHPGFPMLGIGVMFMPAGEASH